MTTLNQSRLILPRRDYFANSGFMDTAKQFPIQALNFDITIDKNILYKKYEFYRDIIIIDKLYE